MSDLVGKRLTLCVSGSVAAYKAASLARLLVKGGASVDCVLTHGARHFLGEATLSGITGRPVLSSMFGGAGEPHVALAALSDALLIVPATADLMARLASGRASSLVTATALCTESPILIAPAMHPSMWAHPATKRNLEQLRQDGRVEFVGPVVGEVASGDEGMGRMAEPEAILEALLNRLSPADLQGRRFVVTAGPTLEDLDPVRFLGNRSSGKMGYALAQRARARGATVTLISGPVALPAPSGVTRQEVRSAGQMQAALQATLGPKLDAADVLIMAAAVGDYRAHTTSSAKLKRGSTELSLQLVPNPDLLAELGAQRQAASPLLVGFAVETGSDAEVVHNAEQKLQHKRCDLIVANHANEAFGGDDNRATLVSKSGSDALPRMSKLSLADRILDQIRALLEARSDDA